MSKELKVPESIEQYRMTDLSGIGVYVGTYRKYNNGSLYGMWVDLEACGDEDTFMDVIKQLHYDEKDPEYMYQDFQCFPRKFYEESHLDLEGIFEWLEHDENERDIIEAYWSDRDDDVDMQTILDRYVGKDLDFEDMAREEVEMTLAQYTAPSYGYGKRCEIPSWILNNIDYKGVADDLFESYFECGDGYWFDDYRAQAMIRKWRCCLCGKMQEGEGNNPSPLSSHINKCCDECNDKKVIPARIEEFAKFLGIQKEREEQELVERRKKEKYGALFENQTSKVMKYKYIYSVYTDNMCWGRILLGVADTLAGANSIGRNANKGVFVVEKKRKYIK